MTRRSRPPFQSETIRAACGVSSGRYVCFHATNKPGLRREEEQKIKPKANTEAPGHEATEKQDPTPPSENKSQHNRALTKWNARPYLSAWLLS